MHIKAMSIKFVLLKIRSYIEKPDIWFFDTGEAQ